MFYANTFGLVLLIILCIVCIGCAIFCILGIIACIVEKDFEIMPIAVLGLVIIVLLVCCGVSCFEEPPETIEKDGYTYTLYEEPPEEFIKHNGHTYVLGDSVNE